MKKFLFLVVFCFPLLVTGQESADRLAAEKAMMNYLEGFYEGDTLKLAESLRPGMYKTGYWKNKSSGKYDFDGRMTYDEAIQYARNVLIKKNFAKPGSPKKVEVLDISKHTAAGKVYAWWGSDYILLSRQDGRWMIDQVLWEGPPETKD
ncbi:MAG TPA: nuclear transport factor 2 family protein [Saprospiraceae bacterium]|nr:nuclear transport factor 2 family protein [Saprospiraceae bacterium]HNT22449.1 nuclear transport factor 2 family protein [Saprospiraceae bacterium]